MVGSASDPERSSIFEVADATAGLHYPSWRRGDDLPAAQGAAQSYPTRPIRLIVPYPAGGGTDIVARVIGQKLHESLGQPVVIDNRGGAGGTLGTAARGQGAPDGYTLVLVPTSHVINPSIYAKLPYDTEKDFAPITMVASAAILMAVNPSVPADTMRGFIEAAKANPQAIANYGSAGAGTVFHLTGELFKQLTGLPLQHVPYRGGAPDRDRAAGGRDPARLRDHVGAAAPCPRRHAARARDHEPAAQRHNARYPDHRRGRFPARWSPTIRTPCLRPPARRRRSWRGCTTPRSRRSGCRTSATSCASRAPRWSATARPSWPPMLRPRSRNGPRWRARPA